MTGPATHPLGDGARSGWKGPLAGIRVIDFTRILAGPFVTQLLGDLGADIIKIEPPGGDDTRRFPPFLSAESHYFFAANRGKRSVGLDLKRPEGAALARALAKGADILVENYRPGVMKSFGLSYDELAEVNPGLIYCSVSGFGLSGPLRDFPSFDAVTQALSGALSVNGRKGEPPVKIGLPIGDLVAGVFAPLGILSVLHERNTTGRGRLIDASLYDGLMGMLTIMAQLAFVTGRDPEPLGSDHPNLVPYSSYEAADGSIIIAALSDKFWASLCGALERDDLIGDSRFATTSGRRAFREEIDGIVADAVRRRTVAEWQERLTTFDVPHAPVLGIRAALAHPHAVAREMVVSAQHPTEGDIRMIGRSVKFPGSPQVAPEPPPLLGQHSEEVLKDLVGLDHAAFSRLVEAGIVVAGERKSADA